ncbi:MAG: hypothetical protein OET90_10920 [Desulfuromonadales bacterium]|nr:hypothetical protein [Desulfuromonadales bacterium]
MRINRQTILLAAMLLLLLAAPLSSLAEELTVQVRNTPLRATPSFLGTTLETLEYGDRVRLLYNKDTWARVQTDQHQGWLHPSALTSEEIELVAGAVDVEASTDSDEVALAGKGFNSEVEQEFREQKKLNYQDVDRVESFSVSALDKVLFLEDGDLSGAEAIK